MTKNTENSEYSFDDVNIRIEQMNLDEDVDVLIRVPTKYLMAQGYTQALLDNLELIKEKTKKDLRFWVLPDDMKVELLPLTDNHDVILYAPHEYFRKDGFVRGMGEIIEKVKQKSGKDFGFWIVPDNYKITSVEKGTVKHDDFVGAE